MRILLVSFVGNNRWSGMGKWSHRMAEELTKLGHSTNLWFEDDFPILKRTGRLSVLMFPFIVALRLLCQRSRFDVVVIHEPSGLWYGMLRRLLPSLPQMVAMCHNIESRHFGDLMKAASRGLATVPRGTRIKTPLFRLWQSDGTIRMADHVVCLSTIDRSYLVNHLSRHPNQVTCLINGVATENFYHRAEASQGQRVLFVGGWLDVKGRKLLPSIWLQVRTKFPHALLTMIGTGQTADLVLRDFDPADRSSVTVIPRLDGEAEMTAQFAAH